MNSKSGFNIIHSCIVCTVICVHQHMHITELYNTFPHRTHHTGSRTSTSYIRMLHTLWTKTYPHVAGFFFLIVIIIFSLS